MTEVVLVNEQDEAVGTMEKMEAHRKPHLHRAFSIFIFNNQNEMLLQRRALSKYHSGGLWTNACCSHPFPDEAITDAAIRRLKEELGVYTPLEKAFHFIYQAEFDNGLYEHEFDHVFIGSYNGMLHPNPEEVADYCFKSMQEIRNDLELSPEKFTPWFKIALPYLEAYMQAKIAEENMAA
ncbi:MAG: isopentenyl-diphosphate Delta-isomerase [Chitinophagaceae bacterium]|jgi:isopentenyl-diphosphate delta-isomerase|nr:isopentenyl-diphosphate Delta-isomerase [Chitinophagaceae bacterium]MCU0403163.1 isopentenyl-diphosphate Delta-isomerase [Chitinophagaceae bacterium]